MKKIFYSITAIAAALLLSASFSASAQDANKDLLIGSEGSNWFIGVGGGVNITYDEKVFSGVSPAIELNIGKWFTPAIGFRAGYHGIQGLGAANLDTWLSGKERFSYNVAHVDAMWTMANSASYKASRVWNPILYARGGFIFPRYQKLGEATIALGAGLSNQFRLGDAVSLAIDISTLLAPERQFRTNKGNQWVSFPSATLGLVFNLAPRGFHRPAPVAAKPDTRVIDDLRTQLKAANDKADEAARAAAAARAKLTGLSDGQTYEYKGGNFFEAPVKEIEKSSIVPEILYFDLGKATLTGRELARLEYYAENTFKKDQQLLVTGCADLGTGTKEANDRLSKQRAEFVKNVLVNQFGYNAANIETKADVMPGDSPIKGRIVTIEVK